MVDGNRADEGHSRKNNCPALAICEKLQATSEECHHKGGLYNDNCPGMINKLLFRKYLKKRINDSF